MPTPPPRNAAGAVIAHDHDEIKGEHSIIRRISEQQLVVKGGKRRISSIAYKASGGANGGMSVDIEPFIIAAGLKPEEWVTTPRWIGSVRLNVGHVRTLPFKVGYDPIEESENWPANPYHGEVWGDFTKAQQTALQQAAQWFVKIEDTELL